MSGRIVLFARESVWALHRLARRPLFVAVAALTLGAAIAPSLIFQQVDRAVLLPLPYERSEELVAVRQRAGWGQSATSYPKLRLLREESQTLDLAANTAGVLFLERGEASIRLWVNAVTPNFFSVLGARPLLGRTFRDDENERGFEHPVIVLSERIWRLHFGARPDVPGETIDLGGHEFTILGVMAGDLRLAWWSGRPRPDAWIPATMAPLGMLSQEWRESPAAVESANVILWGGVARLREGHTLKEARAEAAVLGERAAELWPGTPSELPFEIELLEEHALDPELLRAVDMLQLAGALVVLLGGINLGQLLIARSLERKRVVALHAILGAPRIMLAWGILWEAIVLGVLGAGLALLAARGAFLGLSAAEPSLLTSPFGVTFDPGGWGVDGGVAGLAVGTSILAALLSGLVPAWRATRLETAHYLGGSSGVTGPGLRQLRATRPRGWLVIAETVAALAVALPALLLVRSLHNLVTSDLGFRTDSVATASLALPGTEYTGRRTSAFVSDATSRIARAAGIESASWTSCLPIECGYFSYQVRIPDSADDEGIAATVHVVAPDLFHTLGIPLRNGRDFDDRDSGSAPRVVILSELAAGQLAAGASLRRVEVPNLGEGSLEVVGVVGDVPYGDLAAAPLPAIYLPLAQHPRTEGELVVRTASATASLAPVVHRALSSLDASLEAPNVVPLSDRLGQSVARFRGAALLLSAAAALALTLFAIGIYALLWSLVTQTRREVAIRRAVGASSLTIGFSIAGSALQLAAIGIPLGAALGVWGATRLESYLFGIPAWDAAALAAALGGCAGLALLAALRPAIRASRADPMAVLRSP